MTSKPPASTFGKYWICEDCAQKKGAVVTDAMIGITVVHGICGWCAHGPQMLIPIRDFRWTNGRPVID